MYFTFNGRKSTEFGITIAKQPNWVTPEPRAEVLNIAGLNGTTIETHGFLPYIINMDIIVEGKDNIDDIRAWLKGKGYYTRSEEPNNKLWVEMQSAPSFRYVVDNLYTAPLTIYVVNPEMEVDETYREKLKFKNGATPKYLCYNHGNFLMKPLLEFKLRDTTTEDVDIIIRANGEPIKLTIAKGVKSFIVDFDLEQIVDKNTRGIVGSVVGPPNGMPRFKVGENEIIIQEDLMWYGVNLFRFEGLFMGETNNITIKQSGSTLSFEGNLVGELKYNLLDAKVRGGWNNGKGRTVHIIRNRASMSIRPEIVLTTRDTGVNKVPIDSNSTTYYIEPEDEITELYIRLVEETGHVETYPEIRLGLGHIGSKQYPEVDTVQALDGKDMVVVESIYTLKRGAWA